MKHFTVREDTFKTRKFCLKSMGLLVPRCNFQEMVSTKQPIVYLGYKHYLNVMVSCARSCMGRLFGGVDCLQAQIIRVKCNKRKESMSLENTKLVETYTHRHKQDTIYVLLLQWSVCIMSALPRSRM